MTEATSAGTTYQMVTLTPGLAQEILKDGSPTTVLTELWQFLNTDLMTANLTPVDFLNVMDFVDIHFSNMLLGIPENHWEELQIQETLWDKDPDTGQIIKVETKVYSITELWDAVRAKVYIKCCNSRGGHLIKTLTESKQTISQLYEERGVNRPPEYLPASQGGEDKGSWRPL